MELQLLHDIIEEGFDAVEGSLGIESHLLATMRERVEATVTGNGLLDPDDARLLRWVVTDWGERLVALRTTSPVGFGAARDRVNRLVALVKLTLAVRGVREDAPPAPTNERKHQGPDATPSQPRQLG